MTNPTNNLAALIQAERKRAAAKIAQLRRAAAVEQKLIDEQVVALLHELDPDLYERLAREALDALADEKAQRSSRAKKSARPPSDVHELHALHAPRDAARVIEEAGSW